MPRKVRIRKGSISPCGIKLLEPTGERTSYGKSGKKLYDEWLVRCSCGVEWKAIGIRVHRGDIKSCGCSRKSKDIDKSAISQLLTMYKYNAKKRNYEFRLRYDSFYKLVKQNCYFCGSSPRKFSRQGFTAIANGIDRIDNTKGYTTENSVPCCTTCNRMKGDLPYRTFMNQIVKIIKLKIGKLK